MLRNLKFLFFFAKKNLYVNNRGRWVKRWESTRQDQICVRVYYSLSNESRYKEPVRVDKQTFVSEFYF